MRKTKLILATTIALMLSFATTAFAGFESVNAADVYPQTETIYIDNNPVEIDTININGSKYIPLRKVSEALGCTVDYQEDVITIVKDQGYQTSQAQVISDGSGGQANTQIVKIEIYPENDSHVAECRRIVFSSKDNFLSDSPFSNNSLITADGSFIFPVILDGSSYIPLRYLCYNGLNCNVNFANDVVHITTQPLQQFPSK